MAFITLTKIGNNELLLPGKRILSFWSSGGWNKLEPFTPDNSGPAESVKGYDFKFFVRDLQQGITEPLQGKTTGDIPRWLSGSLLQNGPGKFTFGDSTAKHWFDGSAVIQKFKLKDGKATYECQFLNSETYKMNSKANRHVVSEFCTPAQPDPCKTIFQRFQTTFTPFVTDNCCVSIYPIDGNLFALTETPKMHRLDVDKVNTAGMIDLNKKFKIMSHSAHPHVLSNGNVYNVALSKGEKGPAYAIYEIPNKQGKGFEAGRVVAKIPCTWPWNPCYMHSFGITDSYYIVIEQPLSLDIKSMMVNNILGGSFTDTFRWKDVPVNLHVVDRRSGELKTYTTDTFFFFHTINQYEDSNHIVLDVCTYDNAAVINGFMMDAIKGKNWPQLFDKIFSGKPLRLVLPLNSQDSGNLVKLPGSQATAKIGANGVVHVKPEVICDEFCELPRFNQDYLAKKYNYFYGLNFCNKMSSTGKIMKIDVNKKKIVNEWYQDETAPSEPIFVPSPNSKSEDDGVLVLSLLSAKKEDSVCLVVLDAKDLKELARTEFTTPGPIPKTIHGWFS